MLDSDKKQGEVHPESRTPEPLYQTGAFKDKRSPDIQISYTGVSTEGSDPSQGRQCKVTTLVTIPHPPPCPEPRHSMVVKPR